MVWVVDDSPLDAQALRSALCANCDVTVFPEGTVLLEALGRSTPPDVLVLDWEMPGITGIEVCHFLRGNPATQELPVLMVTVHQRSEDVVEGLAAGANDYAFKPFRPAELLARVRALAYWRQLRQRAAAEAAALTRKHLTDEQARRQFAESSLREVQEAERQARRNERRFRLAARATRDLIWEWDPAEDTFDMSGGTHPLLEGVSHRAAPLAEWLEGFVHPDDRERLLRGFRSAVTGAGEDWQDAHRFRCPDGTWADVVNRACIVRDARGRAVQVVGALQDVTAQKRLENEARERQAFEQQLIGIVSHDLRTPLAAIRLTAAALTQDATDERVQRGLRRITLSTERAGRMIGDLLDFTRARQGGGLPIHRRPTNLHALTRNVVEEAQALQPDARIEVVQVGDGKGEWDEGRLAQVISNLVGNALQYGLPDMPVRVATQGEGDMATLEVHNHGSPIPSNLLPRIFEPLTRGAEIVSQTGRSIGLGLFIVRHIVQAHGGTVDVRSTLAAGTTFTVRLPRHLPAGAQTRS